MLTCETCSSQVCNTRSYLPPPFDNVRWCDSCFAKTRIGKMDNEIFALRMENGKLRKYRRSARRAYRELQIVYERSQNRINERARYTEMMGVAKQYYKALEESSRKTPAEIAVLKEYLDVLSEPFSDDPAFVAFLNMKRVVAGVITESERDIEL